MHSFLFSIMMCIQKFSFLSLNEMYWLKFLSAASNVLSYLFKIFRQLHRGNPQFWSKPTININENNNWTWSSLRRFLIKKKLRSQDADAPLKNKPLTHYYEARTTILLIDHKYESAWIRFWNLANETMYRTIKIIDFQVIVRSTWRQWDINHPWSRLVIAANNEISWFNIIYSHL